MKKEERGTVASRMRRYAFIEKHLPLCRLLYDAPHGLCITALHRTRNGALLVQLARKVLGYKESTWDVDILLTLARTYTAMKAGKSAAKNL